MAAAPRIALIHALRFSIEPIGSAFAAIWPEAEITNVLDDSLSRDRAAAGRESEDIQHRMAVLADYVVNAGADAILFTCSAFGHSIDQVKAHHRIPVLKPNEAMVEDVTALSGRIGVLATFAPTLDTIKPEFELESRRLDKRVELELVHVKGAFEFLETGDLASHDRLITDAARSLGDCKAIVLSQYSMARAENAVATATGVQVFTTPGSAVRKVRALLSED